MSAQYQYIRELGSGTFGCVVLAKDVSTGQNVAVKKIPRSQVQGYTLSELINHSMLRHPHIVKFHQVFLSPTNVNIVMEYVPGAMHMPHELNSPGVQQAAGRASKCYFTTPC